MIGYKAFDENLCCRGFQFEVGKTYTKETKKEEMMLCSDGVFHFCRELHEIEKCSEYSLKDSRICEVIAGDVVSDGSKFGTNNITILREIVGNEKSALINSGNGNSGYCNSTDAPLRMFNKDTDVNRYDVIFPDFFYFDLIKFVSYDTATDEERKNHKKEIETCGGFLRTLDYKAAWRLSWDKASDEDRRKVLNLPNWNNDVFLEISGIDVEKELNIK